MHRDDADGVSLTEVHRAELGLADARCVRQYSVEHGLQMAGRARYYLQYLRRRGLPLQRLGKVRPGLGELARTRLKLLLELARVRLELLFRCSLRFLRPAEMTHAGRPKLRFRRSELSTPGRLLCETGHSAGP